MCLFLDIVNRCYETYQFFHSYSSCGSIIGGMWYTSDPIDRYIRTSQIVDEVAEATTDIAHDVVEVTENTLDQAAEIADHTTKQVSDEAQKAMRTISESAEEVVNGVIQEVEKKAEMTVSEISSHQVFCVWNLCQKCCSDDSHDGVREDDYKYAADGVAYSF